MNYRHTVTTVEIALVVLLGVLILLGPVAHGWFEWRINRDVASTQAQIEHRLAAVEGFVESRKAVAPQDVLEWLRTHSVPCPQNCEPCPDVPGDDTPRPSDAPIDNGS